MFILLLSVTDVHKITIFVGKFGSTKTTIVHSCYVVAGVPGRAIKMDKMSEPGCAESAHAHLYYKSLIHQSSFTKCKTVEKHVFQ